ncbi:unnamed protein product [Cuscuta campestris]|uniref:HAT C-terminal dimerisation domain-containing protein n=1 Tax=Cuscuta campestris TaxID=132261 RepID=A0A484KYL1_9ASTE|nr:unnamed protein product [Cuscuta campestris]
MGAVNRSLRKGKAKATSDCSTSHGSRGRHPVSSFHTIPDQFIGDGMTDEEFDQIYSGKGDANLPTLDSLFEDVHEAELDNLDGDKELTPHNNDVDVEAGVPCDYDEDDVEFDILGWWKRNEHMFPCLGKLARQVLSIPVSTVAVEREFSAGGNILNDFRSCLNGESLETLVCNQDWLLARRRAQESGYEFNSEHYMNAITDGSPSSEE